MSGGYWANAFGSLSGSGTLYAIEGSGASSDIYIGTGASDKFVFYAKDSINPANFTLYKNSSGVITISGASNGHSVNIGFKGVESISNPSSTIILTSAVKGGTVSADSITGTVFKDKILGLDGNDTINGAAANDSIDGGNGNDSINGSTGNDILKGAAGADIIKGGTGSDSITGGTGKDYLYGGASDGVKDVFYFDDGHSGVGVNLRDRVFDFVSGKDKIDLHLIDANAGSLTDQSFGSALSSVAAAYKVWFVKADADGDSLPDDLIVRGDVNGNTTADFEIAIIGVTTVVSTDFVF